MTQPLVSIGLPIYNEERHLRGALDSVLAQTYPALEVVISDNASTDATSGICREYAARDPRVKYHRQPQNLGAGRNFNRCLELARGEYFKWASGHDELRPELIARGVAVLSADPALALCYTPTFWEDGADEAGHVVTAGERNPFARLGAVLWGVKGGAVYGVYRTGMLRQTLGFEAVVAPDVILLAELSVLGGFARLDGPTLILKQGAEYGDWRAYVEKIFGEVPCDSHRLFSRALVRLCRRTGRHFRGRGKATAYMLAATAFRHRFRLMREGLASLPQ